MPIIIVPLSGNGDGDQDRRQAPSQHEIEMIRDLVRSTLEKHRAELLREEGLPVEEDPRSCSDLHQAREVAREQTLQLITELQQDAGACYNVINAVNDVIRILQVMEPEFSISSHAAVAALQHVRAQYNTLALETEKHAERVIASSRHQQL